MKKSDKLIRKHVDFPPSFGEENCYYEGRRPVVISYNKKSPRFAHEILIIGSSEHCCIEPPERHLEEQSIDFLRCVLYCLVSLYI